MKKLLVLSALVLLCSSGCKSKTDEGIVYDSAAGTQQPQAQATPQPPVTAPAVKHAAGKFGDTVYTASGLGYIDRKVGTGPMPKSGQTITVNYTGKLTNGQTFDSNVDPAMGHVEPFSTPIGVGSVIPGWDEGMMSMKVGGKRTLIVPSDLGYGPAGSPPKIPGNATLIFDVELLKVS